MSETDASRVTVVLERWRDGDDHAAHDLLPLVQRELRRLARIHMAGERRGHMLQTTALVNEAYIRLVDARRVRWRDRTHFFAMVARLMRRVLIDVARAGKNLKRGGAWQQVPFDPELPVAGGVAKDVLAVDAALRALRVAHPRQGRVVELRFFAGLSVAETARVLGVSEETALRDWRFAKHWLLRELSPA